MSKKKVLVVDDEMHISRLIQVNLERQGHNVSVASDGREAIQLLEAEPFDWAVIDILMPHVDGYEVLKWIRTNDITKDMKVALVTTQADDYEARTDLEYRADRYISKPFNPADLVL